MVLIPASFKAYEYSKHSQDVFEELKLNPNATLAPLEPNEVTVKIYSAAVNPCDWKSLAYGLDWCPIATPASPEHPVIMGMDFSGLVVAVGSNVKDHHVGDPVYAMANFEKFGSFAEYINIDSKYIAPKPAKLSFNEAAGVPLVSQTSYQALFVEGKLQTGQRVLILGGSTATGIYGIQQAKTVGAYVIATCSARNAEFVKSLGADQVIDYTKEKWSEVLKGGSIDLIYDCGAEPDSWNDVAQKVLKKDTGIFVTIMITKNPIESPIGATLKIFLVQPSSESLELSSKLIEEGKLKVVVDSVYPFEDTFKAIQRQMTGHATGKIIIEIAKEQRTA